MATERWTKEELHLGMMVTRAGETDGGVTVPVGTLVQYLGHVVGGMVRVGFENGDKAVMHPACFDELNEQYRKTT